MKRFFLVFLCALIMSCVLLTACGDKNKGDKAEDSTAKKETTAQTTAKNEADSETDAETDKETESDTTDSADSESDEETTASDEETEKAEDEDKKDKEEEKDEDSAAPMYTNPLTGLPTLYDISKKRPVAIMVGNSYDSLPQDGVGQADVLFECLAEGGIPRLMMLTTYYDEFKKVGSIRSARDYFIDYADGFNAIFVHAGGSPYAYNTIANRGVNNVDGVNGSAALHYTYYTFARDPERLNRFNIVHTLVVNSGQSLVNAINYLGYKTEKATGYEEPFNFVDFENTTVLANKATHAKVVMSYSQIIDFVYDEESGKYLRYQYNGVPHIDNNTGEQLSFKNVIVLFTYTHMIPGDDSARIDVGTTGSGSGWYMTDGTYQKITWKKDSATSILRFYYEDGTEVELNRGKTMINVVPSYNESGVTFDNSWN